MAEEMVRDAVTALTKPDLALAAAVVKRDDDVDAMNRDVEELCVRLVALQQPVASDLRLISTALKVVTDLERIGDHAADISKIALRLGKEYTYQPLIDVPRLAAMATSMLYNSLRALTERDLTLVKRVIDSDDEVDELYAQMKRDLNAAMKKDPSLVPQASHLLFVAAYLERICDHCVSIAERVEFVQTGRSPRLRSELEHEED